MKQKSITKRHRKICPVFLHMGSGFVWGEICFLCYTSRMVNIITYPINNKTIYNMRQTTVMNKISQ